MRLISKNLTSIGTVLCIFAVSGTAPAQEEESPWEDLLKDVVEEALEGSGDGEVGQIRRIKPRPRGSNAVDLAVELRGVDDPGRVGFEVEVYGDDLQVLGPLDVTWDDVPDGDGRTVIHLAFRGDGTVRSVAANVSLVDRDTGRLSSRRKVALPWEWEGDGTGGGSSGWGGSSSPAASAGGLSTRSDGGGAVDREPVIVTLDPSRVGDTPKPEEIKIAMVQSARVVPTTTRKPARRPAPRPAPRPTPKPTGQMTAVTSSIASGLHVASATVDLYDMAPKARWSSGKGQLPFNGSKNDDRGFVRQLGRATMIDGKSYDSVLQTHPRWVDNGTIRGSYSLTIPAAASRFEARVGFLRGVTRSNGVDIKVQLSQGSRGTAIVSRKVSPSSGVVSVNGTIPKSLRGQKVTLTLYVHAAGASTQDWFAWIGPVIK